MKARAREFWSSCYVFMIAESSGMSPLGLEPKWARVHFDDSARAISFFPEGIQRDFFGSSLPLDGETRE